MSNGLYETGNGKLYDSLHEREGLEDPILDNSHPDCPECGNQMNFFGHNGKEELETIDCFGECPSCGYKITGKEVEDSYYETIEHYEECPHCERGYMRQSGGKWYKCQLCGIEAEMDDHDMLGFNDLD